MPKPLAIESRIRRGRSAVAADGSLEVTPKVKVKKQGEEEEEEEEDVLICGTEHLWPSKRGEAWMSDCKTDQNAITTCFECLFMFRLRLARMIYCQPNAIAT